MEKSSNLSDDKKNTNKSTLKILEEVDKEIIQDNPPNFSEYNFTREHQNEAGKLPPLTPVYD